MLNKTKIVILFLTALLIFTACAAPTPQATQAPATEEITEEAATQTPATQPATEEASPYPVTIEHKYGSTTITKKPERIVLVGLTEQDALLALGIIPVATREWWGGRPGAIFEWATDKLGDAPLPVVLSGESLNFEQIISLKPDVIVGLYAGLTKEEYETLAKIAPTVAQPGEYPDWGIPWQELTSTIGQIVGKSAEAQILITDIETRFATARKEHPEFTDLVGVVASSGNSNYWVYSSLDPRGQFLTSLGFKPSAELDKVIGSQFGASIDLERYDLINDVGALIWFTEDVQKTDTLYEQLNVHKEGRDIIIAWDAPMAYAFSFNTVLSLPYVLDELVPQLAAAVDGDPATVYQK